MYALVSQHRLADDIADGEDVRHVGAHLFIDRNETAIGDDDPRFVGGDLLAIRRAAGGLQDHVVPDGFGFEPFTFELDVKPVILRFDSDRLRLQHDLVEAVQVLLFPDFDRIAVRALHQRIEHLDDVDSGAEQ